MAALRQRVSRAGPPTGLSHAALPQGGGSIPPPERGRSTAFTPALRVPAVNGETLRPILFSQISRKSALMTDEGGQYFHAGQQFERHETVNHSTDEYVRGDAHTNSVEGYFSILKRGIIGTYHHVSQQHLKRYLSEFDFRYNERSALGVNDRQRAARALKGIVGKRLTYRRPDKTAHA